jgi:hypothetical protein
VLDWSMCELRTNNSATITATTTASTPTAIVRWRVRRRRLSRADRRDDAAATGDGGLRSERRGVLAMAPDG